MCLVLLANTEWMKATVQIVTQIIICMKGGEAE